MKDPHIILTVGGGHCIEHAAMREYKRMTDMIMDSPGVVTGEQEAAMELLLDFLENADFAFLRSSNELFSGVQDARCILTHDEVGKIFVSAEPIAHDVSDND